MLISITVASSELWAQEPETEVTAIVVEEADSTDSIVKNVLIIGDSMTGWMAERLNAYGQINGFDVATIVWDGSTISKWADSPNLSKILEQQKPDAVIVCLGMNELFEPNPQVKLKNSVEKLKQEFAPYRLLWIGPPSWPGHDEGEILDSWLEDELGSKRYFRSLDLDLPRQSKSNPHPSKAGIELWIDKVAEWIPYNSELNFKSLAPPEKGKMSRGDVFIYKRMNELL